MVTAKWHLIYLRFWITVNSYLKAGWNPARDAGGWFGQVVLRRNKTKKQKEPKITFATLPFPNWGSLRIPCKHLGLTHPTYLQEPLFHDNLCPPVDPIHCGGVRRSSSTIPGPSNLKFSNIINVSVSI